MFWIELRLTFKRNGDGCMRGSPHSKVSSLLPRLHHWVPGQDRGAVTGVKIITTGHVEDIADQGSSWCPSWRRKLSALHLPPLQLVVTGVDGHLVVTALLLIFLIESSNLFVCQFHQNKVLPLDKLTSVLWSACAFTQALHSEELANAVQCHN